MRPRAHWETVSAPARVRVLIVDDHDVFADALRALLKTEGFEVAEARPGEAAIAAAIAFRPAVAVVDVGPGDDAGFRTASRLSLLAEAPSILLMSSAGRRQFGDRLAGRAFVPKADLRGAAIIELVV